MWVSIVVLLIGLVFGSGLNFLDSVSSVEFWRVGNLDFDCWMICSLFCGIVDFGLALNGFGVDPVLLNFLDSVSCVKS